MSAATVDASGVEVAAASWPAGSPDEVLAGRTPRLPLSTGLIRQMSVGGKSSESTAVLVPNSTQLVVPGGPPQYATLLWRQDDCAHVTFVSGRCPVGRHQLALPVAAVAALKAHLGGDVSAVQLERPNFGSPPVLGHVSARRRRAPVVVYGGRTLHEKVVGVFRVPAGQPYWFGQNIGSPVVSPAGSQVGTAFALVPRRALTALPLPFEANVTIDQPLSWARATPAGATSVAEALARLRQRLDSPNVTVLTGIPALLRADHGDRLALDRIVELAEVQVLLLVGLVLIVVLGVGVQQRRAEIISATLHGRRRAVTAAAVMAEPIGLLVLAIAPGVYLGHELVRLGAGLWLRPGTSVHVTVSSALTAVAVLAVAAVAALVVGLLAASRPLAEQLAEDARAAAGRGGAWLEITVMVLAAAGLTDVVSAHAPSTSTPMSLLAPSLCGLAAGLALGRVVRVLLAPAVRATRETRHLGSYLAVRELHRDRTAWRVAAVVTMALSLLTFSLTVSRGAASDRQDRAGLIVGAATVADVSSAPHLSLLSAVAHADPAGHWAMAAELITPVGGAARPTLAIDTTRLPAVAGWTRRIDGYTPAGLHTLLHVSPQTARRALPILTAGNTQGVTFGLSNTPLDNLQPHPTAVLPELLTNGTLADLGSIAAAAPPTPLADLVTATVTQQVWIGTHAPPDALRRLTAAGLHVSSVAQRSRVAAVLQRRATTAGLLALTAVAVLAAALAVALLAGVSIAGLRRQRTETFALTTAGVPRRTITRARAATLGARVLLAVATGFGCGLLTAHLVAPEIPRAMLGAVPSALLPLPARPALLAVTAAFCVAAAAETAIMAYATRPPLRGHLHT